MAKDKIHEAVISALQRDGWEITADPYVLASGGAFFKMDLASEKFVSAEKGTDKIVIEIKSMTSKQLVYPFYAAFGQYMFYRDALNDENIERGVYLAIAEKIYNKIVKIPFLVKRIKQYNLKFIAVNIKTEKITLWKS